MSAAVQFQTYPEHPAAGLMPLLSGDQMADLVADIRERGLLHPIVLYKGQILDGRNRYRACNEAGVSPRFETLAECASPTAYVLSVNVVRRQLSDTDKAVIAVGAKPFFEAEAKERQREHGGTAPGVPKTVGDTVTPSEGRDESGRAIAQAAKAAHVGVTSAKRMDRVARDSPETFEAVKRGDIRTVADAARVAAMPEEDRPAAIQKLASGEAKNAQQARRQIMQAKVAAAPAPERSGIEIRQGDARSLIFDMPERPHLVVTDPPYGIETHRTREGGKDYADGEDYSIDLFRAVCCLMAPKLDPQAHLYVFAGYSHVHTFKAILGEFFDVQDNPIVWVKDNHTMCDFAKWYPNKHEYILFAKMRGSTRPLASCVPDVIECGRQRDTAHSAEKPVKLLQQLVEQSSVRGELVFDPFAGSGSTGVAALGASRHFLGFELSEEWAHAARVRLSNI